MVLLTSRGLCLGLGTDTWPPANLQCHSSSLQKIPHLLIPANTLGEIPSLLLQSRAQGRHLLPLRQGKAHKQELLNCWRGKASSRALHPEKLLGLLGNVLGLQCPVSKSKGAFCEDPLAAAPPYHPEHPGGALSAFNTPGFPERKIPFQRHHRPLFHWLLPKETPLLSPEEFILKGSASVCYHEINSLPQLYQVP